MKRLVRKLILPGLASLLFLSGIQVQGASRGVSVNLKVSEARDAAFGETVELYSESFALVIGNDNYTNGWPKLSNAVKDAELIAETLEAKGFDVELHRNLDSDSLNRVFKRFFILKGDSPSARLFIWYAGHGATVDGEGYLIPTDAPVPTEGAAFKFASVALRDFGTFMRQAVSKHAYAVFDSCFAGTVFSSQRAIPPAAITRATTMPVRQFLTSGDADQTVSDDGAFRELFIRAITGEERSDANGDGYVTASELGMFLGDRVTNLTESMQTPRYGKLRDKNFDRGDFVFTLPEGAVANQLRTGVAAAGSAEITFWNSIKSSENTGEFDAYLKQYPNGTFTALAMVKKTAIERKLKEARAAAQPREKFKVTFIDSDMQASKVANVRQAPFPTSPRVGRLDRGDKVWVVGQTQTRGGVWYKVARDGVELGFVYAPLLASIARVDDRLAIRPLPAPEMMIEETAAEPDVAKVEQSAPALGSIDDRLSFLVEGLLEDKIETNNYEKQIDTEVISKIDEVSAALVPPADESNADEPMQDTMGTVLAPPEDEPTQDTAKIDLVPSANEPMQDTMETVLAQPED
ncbi:MAG: caspase family protein, partial [Gammaproteobacteria bacterium]|nr:caspase family protein [Gammaproteobacteria bacterium]